MKRIPPMFTLLSVAAFMAGCNNERTTTQQLDQGAVKTEEAAQDMKDYSYAQRAEFTEKMQSQLAGINKDMDQLAARIEKSSDAIKAEAQPRLQSLREQAARLNQQLVEAGNATESTWDSVKVSTRNAYETLKEGFQQSRQWVSEKIAP